MTDASDVSSPPARRTLLPYAICARRGGFAVAALLGAIGLLFAWQASLLDLGRIGLPGPGFFPLLLGVLLAALAVAIAVERWRDAADDKPVEVGHRDVLIVFAALLVVPIVFEALGAKITLGLFGAALLVLIARTRLWLAAVAAVIAMAGCWYFFEVLLGLQLPTGPF
jgi:hypothetical protein